MTLHDLYPKSIKPELEMNLTEWRVTLMGTRLFSFRRRETSEDKQSRTSGCALGDIPLRFAPRLDLLRKEDTAWIGYI